MLTTREVEGLTPSEKKGLQFSLMIGLSVLRQDPHPFRSTYFSGKKFKKVVLGMIQREEFVIFFLLTLHLRKLQSSRLLLVDPFFVIRPGQGNFVLENVIKGNLTFIRKEKRRKGMLLSLL